MNIQRPYLPKGFDDFWLDTVHEAKRIAPSFVRTTQSDVVLAGFQIDVVEFQSVGGRVLHGWFAAPTEKPISPGFLWLAPYGRWSMPPNRYGTRQGMCSFSFNFHGESAFHEEAYNPERGYFAQGIESAQSWIFRQMFQDSVVALSVLQAQEECNAQQVGAMGMSQGGGIAIWTGAFLSSVRAVCADMAFGAARNVVLENENLRYPLKEIQDFINGSPERKAAVMESMAYFDTINLATRCKVPTLLTYGTKDPAVKEFEVQSIYEALPGTKKIEAIDGGHDWHESMVERNRDWLLSHL